MSYIGREPIIGNFVKLDAISVVNGQASYTMQNGGANFTAYETVNQFLVSLNGILQAPTTSFTVSGSTITFASNLVTGDVIDFIMVLGNTLDIGTPSDNTVSTAKIVDGAITSAKLGSGVGGKILQVVSATDSTTRSTTSTSFVTASNTLSVSITPSSNTSKIFIIATLPIHSGTAGKSYFATLFRDSTNLGDSTNGMINCFDDGTERTIGNPTSMSFLDSPTTTSATTYQVYVKSETGSAGTFMMYSGAKGSITVMEISA